MQHLPIDDYLSEISQKLDSHQNLVITASPGAGKTTRLPPALLKKVSGKILILEPRRMAAIAAADRIAEENQWQLGQEVGYQVRFDSQTTAKTKLIFMTEALLARQMIKDPELSGVDIVILDEFHERSLHVDLTLGLLKELQQLGRDLKIIVMSATLDASKISQYLDNAPLISVPGKLYPLDVHYQKQPQLLQTTQIFYENLCRLVKETQAQTNKDILVFLPGVGEINRALENLQDWAHTKDVFLVPLHGSLTLDEQRKALHRVEKQRIILSTNIAESSVTLDGVNTVIDSGLAKVMRQDHRTGFSRLEMGRISLSSAGQRAGRSARQYPGHCFKMWSKHDELSMPKNEIPEIQRADLSEALLYLAHQGIRDFQKFPWFESPSGNAISKAEKFLQQMGALNEANELTSVGEKILKFPLPPRLGKILITAEALNLHELGIELSAILQERDFMRRESIQHYLGDKMECDISLRWRVLQEFRHKHLSKDLNLAAAKDVIQVCEQLRKLVSKKVSPHAPQPDLVDIRRLLLHSYLDRLCRRRTTSDRALMVGGRGVKLAADSLIKTSEFFVALSGAEVGSDTDTAVRLACGFDKAFILAELKDMITRKKDLFFDEDKGTLYSRESRFIFDLPIDDPSLSPPSPEQIEEFLPEFLSQNLDLVRKKNEAFDSFLTRLAYYNSSLEDKINCTAAHFQQAFALATVGAKNLADVLAKDLTYFLEQTLEKEMILSLKKNVPEKIQVPSGNWLKVEYSEARDPYIEVRIQEVFGMTETPKILNGKKNITLQLLGPNYRPMQVTSDLKSFWQSGYQEVRKELRLKYPKHSWPEDPLTAQPEAKGRPRK